MRHMPAPFHDRPVAGPVASPPRVAGLVLAAGAGTRFGMPKALATAPDGRGWLEIAARRLGDAGCAPVLLVLAPDSIAELARTDPGPARHGIARARRGLGDRGTVVVAERWREGQSASLRAGLEAAAGTDVEAVLVTLVDLPGASGEAERRLLGVFDGAASLARAVDGGRPAHPVLIGRDHWAALAASLSGDRGARDYLRAHGAVDVDITGLGGADDVDSPEG